MAAQYCYLELDDLIIIFDLDSEVNNITREIETILREISLSIDLVKKMVIYRECSGKYHRALLSNEGKFIGYEFNISDEIYCKVGKKLLERMYQQCV